MRRVLWAVLVVTCVGCGGSHSNDGYGYGPMMMTGPSGSTPQNYGPTLVSVNPSGGSTGVPTSTALTVRFGTSMAGGMEQYVDLHVGSVAGPTVPLSCGWSPDRTTLTCTPGAPLASGTMYVLHIGGGLVSQAGQPIDCGRYGLGMGGQWLWGGMMGGATHWGWQGGMMGPGWRGSNGSYGMQFPFVTA